MDSDEKNMIIATVLAVIIGVFVAVGTGSICIGVAIFLFSLVVLLCLVNIHDMLAELINREQ